MSIIILLFELLQQFMPSFLKDMEVVLMKEKMLNI